MDIRIREDERIDDLQYKGLRLIQKKSGFCFGVDAVLLANFADVRTGDRVIDLGTGTGIISILLAGKTQAEYITGLEIQPDMAEMAARSVSLNKLDDKIKIVCGDIKKYHDSKTSGKYNVVVSNPPYMASGRGLINPSDAKAISRHEILCCLDDVVRTAAGLLVAGGQFAMVHRPDRLVDIVYSMRINGIEPKYLRFVHPYPGKKPNLILIKGTKGGNPHLKMMDPLYVYDSNGEFSDEINKIYCRGEINNE